MYYGMYYGMYVAMGTHMYTHLDSIILEKYIPIEPMQSAVVNNNVIATFIKLSTTSDVSAQVTTFIIEPIQLYS